MGMFNDAEREKLFAKIALIGASGSGKTVSALKLAYGLTGDWSKVAVADTENKRALAYVGTDHTGLRIGTFKHAPMYAPYSTDRFSQAIDEAIAIGAEALVFDSFSHEWEGIGGVTHAAELAGGEFWHWKGPKTDHRKLVDKIQQSPIHIIVTIRTKQEYAVVPGGGKNGKNAIEKLGMKPVQSNDLDYEFLIAFHVNEDNEAVAKKDNTGLFKGEEFRLEAEHGQKLREWLIEGKEVKTVAQEKKEAEERKAFILNEFKTMREDKEAVNQYFTQLEIKYKRSLAEFPMETLEELYEKATKPKEEPKVDKTDTVANGLIAEIAEMVERNEAVKKLHDEYLFKMKKEITDLTDKQLKMLYDMMNIRLKKEEAVAQ